MKPRLVPRNEAEQRRGFYFFAQKQKLTNFKEEIIYGIYHSGGHCTANSRHRPRCRSGSVGCGQPHGRLSSTTVLRKKRTSPLRSPASPLSWIGSRLRSPSLKKKRLRLRRSASLIETYEQKPEVEARMGILLRRGWTAQVQ